VLQNKLKHALQDDEAVFGVGVTFPLDIAMLRTLAVSGVEWLFLDLEHGSGDISGLLEVAQISKLLGMDGVARIPNLDYHWVARSLDTGLLSVMIPRVEHREQAELAVQWVKHPPLGIRGMGSPSQFDYSTLPPAERVEISNRETMVVLQIETVEAVDNVQEIASVPGVDALFIGPLDLSLTLGIPGTVASDRSHDLFRRVCQVARSHDLAVGIVCAAQQVRFYYDMGIRMFSIGTALTHMRTQVQAVEAEFRRQLP
jgi:2-dehydro-3-deoxyglucarate aldolase/4-hydroxy-2-oxoheptanedioate aldolase